MGGITKKNIILGISFFAVALTLGVFLAVLTLPSLPEPAVDDPSLPVAPVYLANRVVRNLFAMTEGAVVVKSDDSFILENNSRRITVIVRPTTQFDIEDDQGGVLSAHFQDVRVGDYVRGGVIVVMEDDRELLFGNRQPGDLVGNQFSIRPKAQ